MSECAHRYRLRLTAEYCDVQLDALPVSTQWAGATAERIDVALSPARVLGVGGRLDRVQLNHSVCVLRLKIDAAARLDPAADDSGDLFKPCANVRLNRGSLFVRQHLVGPIFNRLSTTLDIDFGAPETGASSFFE
jgi:hypothetical protein